MAVGTAALIIAGVSAGIQAYGQWRAGSDAKKAGTAQQRAAEAQADLLDYNAQVADLQAQDARERGVIEESRFRAGVRGLVGSQRVGFAGQNVTVDVGSAGDVTADSAFLGELDAQTIRQNTMREAWGFEVEAADIRQQAAITRKEGIMVAAASRRQQTAARIGAFSGALGTGASLLEARYGFGRTPAPILPSRRLPVDPLYTGPRL